MNSFLYSQEGERILEMKVESPCLVLNLTTALSYALNANRQLLDQLATLTQTHYGIDLARSEFKISMTPHSQAGYQGGNKKKEEWTLGGRMDFNKKFQTGTLVSIGPSLTKTGKNFSAGIQTQVIQPLLRGLGKDYHLSHLLGAQFALRSAHRHVYLTQVQLIRRTIQLLYDMVKAEKAWILSKQNQEQINLLYQATQIKEKIGIANSLDVYRAEREWQQAQDSLNHSQKNLEEAKDDICDLLALPLETQLRVDLPLSYTPPTLSLEQAIATALENRIEIEQAEDERDENERLSRLAKKNLSPELNLVLNYSNLGKARHFQHACFHGRENCWGIGLTTAGDFHPLAEQLAYEKSLLALDSTTRGMEQTKAQMMLEVKRTFRQLDRAYERICLQENQMKTAREQLSLTRLKFDHGRVDYFQVIQAEKSLRSAQQAYEIAVIDHMIGEFQLLIAMGLLIDKPLVP